MLVLINSPHYRHLWDFIVASFFLSFLFLQVSKILLRIKKTHVHWKCTIKNPNYNDQTNQEGNIQFLKHDYMTNLKQSEYGGWQVAITWDHFQYHHHLKSPCTFKEEEEEEDTY